MRNPTKGFVHEEVNSLEVEWYTPPFIFQKLNTIFDMDVCSAGSGKDYVPSFKKFTKQDDGLSQQWDGLVWCNPPYGTQTGAWLKKMKEHNNGIALVFARTGTKWWHETVTSASLVCFISGRLKFIDGNTGQPGGSAGADSVLIAWGQQAKELLLNSGLGLFATVVQ